MIVHMLLTPRQLICRIKDLSSYSLYVHENMPQWLKIQSANPLHKSPAYLQNGFVTEM